MNTTLTLITALFAKHFVVDFLLQTEYQWSNKGKYGHPGGLLHAWLHGWVTFCIFEPFAPLASMWLGLIDMMLHYHIDWAKMKINQKTGWGPNTHEQFWWLLGLDQFLHAMTYVFLVYLVTP